MKFVCLISILAAVTACGRIETENDPLFDGMRFSSKILISKTNPKAFDIVVANAAKSLAGAREAGRWRSTVYCVRTYGTSDVDWVISPDADAPVIENGDLILTGACRT
jgi:hypothetical protein